MPTPVIVTLFDQGRPQWRRSNLAGRPPRLLPAELAIWRAAFDGGLPTQAVDADLPEGVVDARCWPVHELDWRREILRTEIEEAW